MNLQEVPLNSQGFRCTCLGCGKTIDMKEIRWTDLGGEPFHAYYCHQCFIKYAMKLVHEIKTGRE